MKSLRGKDPLEVVPGIGPSLAIDLRDLGIQEVGDLSGEDPEDMYSRLNQIRGQVQDPCVLYVFRCAVYFASIEHPDPELLKWWAWKGRRLELAPSQTVLETGTDSPRRNP